MIKIKEKTNRFINKKYINPIKKTEKKTHLKFEFLNKYFLTFLIEPLMDS